MRALTECNQAVLIDEVSGRLESEVASRPGRTMSKGTATEEENAFLNPSCDEPLRQSGDYPPFSSDDLRDDVIACVEIAAQRGLETLVLDQTRPDIGMPAVKVLAPGLRHFWPRYAPGRLYEVPLALGWVSAPTPEDELNPEPFPG